ncbi:MAG: diacylglycerol kinase family lipid kinase [Opitutae bacterium]|nr:diacylglycerol kinase family lipid kinase [Opitutae bacterium]
MKVRFIFNPHSGSNRRNPILRDRAAEFIAHCGWDGQVVSTERPRHATELARAAVDEGCDLVVAIGGDGTMNEVASALVNTPATFGLIPCGSGNGLGRHLGIPHAGKGAFRALRDGHVVTIDAGKVNEDLFFCAAGAGFEALIASRFAMLTSRGFSGYLRESAKAWWNYQPERYTIHHAAGTDAVEAFTLAIANSSQYGNNAYIAPDASVSDGLLDVVAVPNVNVLRAVPLVVRLFHGSINRAPDVQHFQGSQFVIERARPGWMHTDGEPRAETSRIEVSALPRSLRVMVPRDAAMETNA